MPVSTTPKTNYASTFTVGAASIGDCLIIDYPEILTGNIDATTHGSAGVEARIPDGLTRVGEFTLELVVASGVLTGIQTAMAAKTVGACIITTPGVASYTFNGFYTSYKPEASDAQSPDLAKCSVTIQPTGGITIANL